MTTGVVVDASVLIRALAEDPGDELLRQRLASARKLHAPAHVGVEVLNGIRGLTIGGKLTETRARRALEDFVDMPITRYAVETMAARVWQLRHNFNAYDGAYVALAQALDVPLLTRDRKIADTAPSDIEVQLHPA